MELRHQVVEVCRRLDARAFVANHDGNVTVRQSDGTFLATPTSFAKADVTHEDLLVVDSTGKVLQGRHKVFSEMAWHLAIYSVRLDVQSIVHGHPPAATGMGLAGRALGTPSIPEAIVSLGGQIPLTGLLRPGKDPALENEFGAALDGNDACVVPGNGVWAVGNDPLHAYLRMELVEQVARAHAVAELFGGARALPQDLVDELLQKRPNRPVTAGHRQIQPGQSPQSQNPVSAEVSSSLRAIIVEELMQTLQKS